MRLSKPRIPPLDPDLWSPEQAASLGRDIADLQANIGNADQIFNVLKTMVRHPALCKAWLALTNHLLFQSTLTPREREIVILRTGWLSRCGYEFSQHIPLSQKAGLQVEEIVRTTGAANHPAWSPDERDLILAVDQLHADCFIEDALYARLATRFSEQQVMDLIFTVGQYQMLAMALNSLGVPLDTGLPEYRNFLRENSAPG